MPQPSQLLAGLLYALLAGLMWGLVFVVPQWLPDYPATLLTAGRYLAFGMVALPMAWVDRAALAQLSRADWLEALKLSAVGNFVYYLCLAAAIQAAGGPLPSVIIGCLPVVIAITANAYSSQHRLAWAQLLPALLVLTAGLACVNEVELRGLAQGGDVQAYGQGAALAVVALVCWTWYPLRNAAWLKRQHLAQPRAWATAQGVVTLPLALLMWAGLLLAQSLGHGPMPGGTLDLLGPRPWTYALAMVTIGLLASWVGTLCWNAASQHLPANLLGQLIVFETLAALAYTYALRGQWPAPLTALGAGLLVMGVVMALRLKPRPQALKALESASDSP